jgi:putative spermidine/putrescine transport system substrate-binding protein
VKLATIVALAASTVLGVGSSALAQEKTLYIAGYGGSYEQTMRKDVIPAFEKEANVKIEYVAGNSTDTLAKLQAQRGNQQIDVAIVDDGPAYQAVALGFCGELTPAPPR